MAVIKDFGVILREYTAGENNKKLALLTRERGKITVFARGGKNAGSKLTASLFSYNEFMIFDGGSFLSLTQIAPIRHFHQITENFESYCFACFFLELVDKMVLAGMEVFDTLALLLQAFSELEAKRASPYLVFAVFTLKLLQKEGFAPLVDACSNCENVLEKDIWFHNEGLICSNCAQTTSGRVFLSPHTVMAIKYILEANYKKAFCFKSSADVQDQLRAAAGLFLAANVEAEFNSLKMLLI